MTAMGGEFNNGTVYKIDEFGNYQLVHSFDILTQGKNACGDLCEAFNGKFYGMTSQGGVKNEGVLFEWNPDSNIYLRKFLFDSALTGSTPKGSLILADNLRLYGMTSQGGMHGLGTIFEWDPATNTFTKNFDFNGFENGGHPNGSLLQANNGKLYGMTLDGGSENFGVLFEWDPSTNSFRKILDFNGLQNGGRPYGSLIQAKNGRLYGMTSEGGISNEGVIFELDLNSDILIKKFDFSDTLSGRNPHGSLLQATNGKLYGMTLYGGKYHGVIFEYDLASSEYQKKIGLLRYTTGCYPYGSLIEGNNGKLYGMTSEGYGREIYKAFRTEPVGSGSDIYKAYRPEPVGSGVIFVWDPVTNIYTPENNIGSYGTIYNERPRGSLVKAKNGRIYGMTSSSIFEWEPMTNLFTGKIGFNNGGSSWERGSLLRMSNGKIMGIYSGGGVNEHGNLFEIDPDNNSYINKFIFDGKRNGSYVSVYGEANSLTQVENGLVYGTTSSGGSQNMGVLFEWDPLNNTFIKKLDFLGNENGQEPCGRLLQADNGKLYGMTIHGGSARSGILYEFDPSTGILKKKVDFGTSTSAMYPKGSLIQASNGKLYGLTSYGSAQCSTFFEWDPLTEVFEKKVDIDPGNLCYPTGSPVEGNNGKFYFTCGSLYEWDPLTGTLSKKYSFTEADGYNPVNSIITSYSGKIYGQAGEGPYGAKGVIYEYDIMNEAYKRLLSFDSGTGYPLVSNLTEYINPRCETVSVCDSLVSPSGKYVWQSSGYYMDTITGSSGTDSIIFISLNIKTIRITVNKTVCDSLVSPSGLFTWTQSGVYRDTISNASGCDSIITINLTVNKSGNSITKDACESFISPSGHNKWTQTGTYTDTIPNSAGCDSIITIHLTITHINSSVIETDSGLVAVQKNAEYNWLNCDNNTKIEGQFSQSLNTGIPGNYAVVISENGCVDTSACYTILPTGNGDDPLKGTVLYPNPTNGSFTINLGKVFNEVRIVITTSDGQKVYEEFFRNTKMILMYPAIPPGSYLVSVFAEDRNQVFKLIRNNPNISGK